MSELIARPSREASPASSPSRRSLRALDGLSFLLADVQTGLGPFLAIFLADHGWNEERVGWALTVGGIAGIVAQTPMGALVDRGRAKRLMVAAAVAALAAGALTIALAPTVWTIMGAQIVIGAASSVFIPAICALSLGLVGSGAFDARQGRNQAFNAAGNVAAALAMGLLGYLASSRSVFFLVAGLTLPTLMALGAIAPQEIDHQCARGGAEQSARSEGTDARASWGDSRLFVFLACAVLFHFANAAMLPLVGQHLLARGGRGSMLFMAACVIVTQLTVACLAAPTGRAATRWGRKPLLLIGFAVLPVRGVLYTLTSSAPLLVGIQVLDGVGAGIFGVVSVLVIADLTRGSGRFNLTLGAITTAVGIGASLSQTIAGAWVHRAGFRSAFWFLSTVAAVAFVVLLAFMPETRPGDAPRTSGDVRDKTAEEP